MQRLDFHKLYDHKRLMFLIKRCQFQSEITAGLLMTWNFTLNFTCDITRTSRSYDIKTSVFSCLK